MTHAFVYLLLVLSHIIRLTILALSQKTYGAHILLVQECLLGKKKEDDIDYAFYSKEPSQLMKEQLGNGELV